MGRRILLVGLLVVLLVAGVIDARRSSSSSRRVGTRGGGGSSRSRTTQRPRATPPPQTQKAKVSEAQKGQDYRNWATKLTGAGNEQRPALNAGRNPAGRPEANPSKIGWNVPEANQRPGGNVATKASAPLPNEQLASKTSATAVQSGYPGNNYGRQPATNPNYNPPANQGYNPPVNQGYNPSYNPGPVGGGQHYNPSYNQPHNPSYNQPYNPSYGHQPPAYNPAAAHPYTPPVAPGGYNPPVHTPQQTVLLVPGQSAQPYKPGIGQLAKEAVVYAGVSAGVNAAVNRLLPGGISGHNYGHSSGTVPVAAAPAPAGTQITYNNYYNNGSDNSATKDSSSGDANANPPAAAAAAPGATASQNPAAPAAAAPGATANQNPAAPAPAVAATAAPVANAQPNGDQGAAANEQPALRNSASPTGYIVTEEDIQKLTEELFNKDKNNAYEHVTLNLQGQKKDDSSTDDAPEPLLTVKPEAFEIPTIKALRPLFDNYEFDIKSKENVTPEERKEETELLDSLLATDVLATTMKFLADKGYIPNDEYEYKDTLRRVWFSQFKRGEGEPSSSGFENVFLAEQIGADVFGLHNWIYLYDQEAAKKANYLGYIKDVKLGTKGAIVKLRASINEIVVPVTTTFVGTSPELEMALYTMCFYTRPNDVCNVSLGGTKFVIIANRVNYFGKDILIAAFPEI